ncbi:MAG TPA: hypothetical protein VF902_00435 [Coriobacteriia bacterium]
MQYRARRPNLWALLAIGFAVGIALGAVLLLWQRFALNREIDALSARLESAEASATAASQLAEGYDLRLASAEASMQALTTQNSELASDLVGTRASLETANKQIAEASSTVTITERSVSPTSVEASHSLVLQVKLQGKPDKVQMKIVGQSGVSYSKTFNLTKSTTSGNAQTWKRSVTAPPTPGTYRYYATAYVGTKSFEMPGVSAWTFEVKAAP